MSSSPNVYAYRGRHLLLKYHARHTDIPPHKLSDLKKALHNQPPTPDLPVCIIGLGVAGLYTAMILESLGISYQIVDADPNKRIGGRLSTHYFTDGGPYDYYDLGAMRFPDTPFMARTFDLARKRSLPVKLIPYIMQAKNTFLCYNGKSIYSDEANLTPDPFNVSGYVSQGLTTPQEVTQKVAQVLEPFRSFFLPGHQPSIEAAMTQLFHETNAFSMRSYMLLRGMSTEDISWCETLDKSTGWYDRALTETVIESLAFNWPTPNPPQDPNAGWHCFDKGSSTLPEAMFNSLPESARSGALQESPVTAISVDPQTSHMKISINGQPGPKDYAAVISTVPLPRLSLMDLTGVNINGNYGQWSAIRELQYGPAIKVGLKFSCPWWQTELPQPIVGGQSFTDLPLRTIVYPSYPEDPTPSTVSNTLIVSYCWTQDAERMGALINRDGTGQPELIDLVFRDLAAVHQVSVEWLQGFYKEGDYYAWDWLRDPLTMGGYAFFGPGVYGDGDIYNELLQPAADGKLFFAGEAASACHAWVAGGLDSAWRAVDQYINLNQSILPPGTQEKFHTTWGSTEYLDETSNKKLVEQNRKLMERHLVIALHKSGIRIPKE